VNLYLAHPKQSIPYPAIRQLYSEYDKLRVNSLIANTPHTISFSHFGTKTGFLTGFSKPFSFENGSIWSCLETSVSEQLPYKNSSFAG